MYLILTLSAGHKVYTGRQVTFTAPCDSEGLLGVLVDDCAYDLVNAMGTSLVKNSFKAGALVSVTFDVEKRKAYVQNADTNKYLEDELAKKFSPDNKPQASDVGLETESWTFTLEDGSTVTKAVYVG